MSGRAEAGPGSIASAGLRERLRIAPEVADALADGCPVVALESTLISHGLPYPQNVEVARGSEAAVRAHGAVPATIAVHGGRILVGLAQDEVERLGHAAEPLRKASRPTLAAALESGEWAGTTVSATLIAAHAAGIDVFATGGIGGVHVGALGGHAGAPPTFDISSDLDELARTPVAVVCAGPKAILDVPATIEYLETRGVPVVAVGTRDVPGFYARSSGIRAPEHVADIRAAAALVRVHFAIGLGSAVLVCVPVPEAAALDGDVAREAIDRAIDEARRGGIGGQAATPWLLARVAELTGGASVVANTALIRNDAARAAELAVALREGAA